MNNDAAPKTRADVSSMRTVSVNIYARIRCLLFRQFSPLFIEYEGENKNWETGNIIEKNPQHNNNVGRDTCRAWLFPHWPIFRFRVMQHRPRISHFHAPSIFPANFLSPENNPVIRKLVAVYHMRRETTAASVSNLLVEINLLDLSTCGTFIVKAKVEIKTRSCW